MTLIQEVNIGRRFELSRHRNGREKILERIEFSSFVIDYRDKIEEKTPCKPRSLHKIQKIKDIALPITGRWGKKVVSAVGGIGRGGMGE